jgi:hypothetical protein
MQTMTMREYLKYAVMKEVVKDAEKEGIRIIDAAPRPKPRLATNRGEVMTLRGEEPNENQNGGER